MDPLSDVLSALKPRSYASAGLDARGVWSIQFPQYQGIKFHCVSTGECWILVDGMSEPVRLNTGDCFLLPSGRSFRVASDLAATPVDAQAVFAKQTDEGVANVNGGGEFYTTGCIFALTASHAALLLEGFPPIVHISDEAGKEALRWSLDRMMQELHDQQPGSALLAEHLAHIMLLQALRLYLANVPEGSVGWLPALVDKQVGAAIKAMHKNPARHWTLQDLAQCACMSRSSFAKRFKDIVGTAPMEYLTRWRMVMAADRLSTSSESIARIAAAVGYESESAFSTAFKRVMGCSPRRYVDPEYAARDSTSTVPLIGPHAALGTAASVN